jgi:hypothetical protein
MVLALLVASVAVVVILLQPRPRHLVTRDCPIPPGPWKLMSDGNVSYCIDPNDPSSTPYAPVPLYTD